MKRVITICASALVLVGFSASAAPASEAECIQSGLNTLGFDAGTVDGQIGNATRSALDQFKSQTEGAPNAPLVDGTMTEWCLFIAGQDGVDDATQALAAPIEAAATVRIRMQVDPAALSKVGLLDADNEVIVETDVFETVEGEVPELVAAFPYSDVKEATRICVMFADGYGVLNAEGKTFKVSCDPQPIAFWLGDLHAQYNTAPMEAE